MYDPRDGGSYPAYVVEKLSTDAMGVEIWVHENTYPLREHHSYEVFRICELLWCVLEPVKEKRDEKDEDEGPRKKAARKQSR